MARKVSLCLLFLLILALGLPAAGASEKKFSLEHFEVYASFPAEAKPGDPVTLSLNLKAKRTVRIQELRVQVFSYAASGELKLILSEPIIEDELIRRGETIEREFSFVVPLDAQRGPLLAIVSESVKRTVTVYYAYPIPYWWYWNCTWGWWPFWVRYYAYPSYKAAVDSAVLALTYVAAPVPEFEELKREHAKLLEQYSGLAAKYEELKEERDRLKGERAAAASRVEELSSERVWLLQELNRVEALKNVFLIATLALAAVLAALTAYLALSRRGAPQGERGPPRKRRAPPKRAEPA